MKRIRRNHTPEFKAKVALAAVKDSVRRLQGSWLACFFAIDRIVSVYHCGIAA